MWNHRPISRQAKLNVNHVGFLNPLNFSEAIPFYEIIEHICKENNEGRVNESWVLVVSKSDSKEPRR